MMNESGTKQEIPMSFNLDDFYTTQEKRDDEKKEKIENVDIKLIWHPSMYQLVIHDYYQMPDDDSGKKVRNNSSGDNALSSYISNSSGMGLEGIRNRVESVDGLVRIMDDDGFKVFVTIPIK